MWIKLCGMTSAEAVDTAVALGVDAIGFVFAPSVRRVEPARAAELATAARGKLDLIAVTQQPTQALLDEIVKALRPDALQADLEDFDRLRLPQTLARLPVLRAGVASCGGWPRRMLFEGPRSGSGETTNWDEAARLARETHLILAGGLNAHNVADAIRAVRPFGVDVSSGIESSPGVKSPEKMTQFVQAARAAFNGMTHEFNQHRG